MCVPCLAGCVECTDRACLACRSGMLLQRGACAAACDPGHFVAQPDPDSTGICVPCHSSCTACQGSGSGACTDCREGENVVDGACQRVTPAMTTGAPSVTTTSGASVGAGTGADGTSGTTTGSFVYVIYAGVGLIVIVLIIIAVAMLRRRRRAEIYDISGATPSQFSGFDGGPIGAPPARNAPMTMEMAEMSTKRFESNPIYDEGGDGRIDGGYLDVSAGGAEQPSQEEEE